MKYMKLQTILIYRYIYRFSVEKLTNMVDDKFIMIVLLQYVMETKMQRLHTKPQTAKNIDAYYRAVENLINESCHRRMILETFKNFPALHDTLFDITFEEKVSVPHKRELFDETSPDLDQLSSSSSEQVEVISFHRLEQANRRKLSPE